MTKVKVSREVAEAIEFQLTGRTPEELLTAHANHKLGFGKFLNGSAVLHGITTITLADALINGYEVEETPEEKVTKYYRELKYAEDRLEYSGQSGSQFRQGWQSVESTLNLLGLKIEGVNA